MPLTHNLSRQYTGPIGQNDPLANNQLEKKESLGAVGSCSIYQIIILYIFDHITHSFLYIYIYIYIYILYILYSYGLLFWLLVLC